MAAFTRLVMSLPLAAGVAIATSACTRTKNDVSVPDTFTFDCKRGLDADCDAQAYAACPNGYENAAQITADSRMQTRVIRCR